MSTVKSFNVDKYITVDCQHLDQVLSYKINDDSWSLQWEGRYLSNLVITRETMALRATFQNKGAYIKCPIATIMKFNNTDEANRVLSALAFHDIEDYDDDGICENIGHDHKSLSIQDISSEMSREYSFMGHDNTIEIPEAKNKKLLVTNNGSHVILSQDDDFAIITIINPSFILIEWVSYPDQPTLVK